jgi:hypothetical protein
MSRNLRAGTKKGFNFAAFAEEDDSDSDNDIALMAPPKPQTKAVKHDFKMRFPAEEEKSRE